MSAIRKNWETALTKWRLRVALCEAEEQMGAVAKANEDWERMRGSLTKGTPEYDAAWKEELASETRFYEDFVRPADEATIDLFTTDAPDLDAFMLKIEAAKAREIWCWWPGDAMAVLTADAERLGL